MADQTRSLVRSSTSGPSGRTIVSFVASYLCSYVLLGLFLVLEQVHSRHAFGVYVDPLFGNPAYIDVTRPYDGLYVMAVSLMLFAPVAFGGFLLGWISGRRSVELAILLAFLYVFPGLMLALWDFPSSSLV